MKSGAPTDIATGRPLEQVTTDKESEQLAHTESILKSKAEFLGLTKTPDGQKLITLVQTHLYARIEALVMIDPQAQCLIKLLTDLGVKENEARKATERLVNMKIKKE